MSIVKSEGELVRWDKKLTAFAVVVVALVIAGAGLLIFFTNQRINTVEDRIAGAAEEGYASLLARIEKRTSDVFQVSVTRKGRFEGQQKYRKFNVEWLKELEYVPGEYLDEDVNYTYSISFLLKSYDTENVYSHRDSWTAYTRYDDGVVMMLEGELYYITYQEGNTVYHFIAKCPPLTDWLAEMKD